MRDLQRRVSRAPGALLATFKEGLRFGAVGIAATLTYCAASLLAARAGTPAYTANSIGYLVSVGVSYYGHSAVTFRSILPHRVQGPRFLAVSLTTYAITNLIVLLVVDLLHKPFAWATIAVATTVPVITWLLSKFWVFRSQPNRPGPN